MGHEEAVEQAVHELRSCKGSREALSALSQVLHYQTIRKYFSNCVPQHSLEENSGENAEDKSSGSASFNRFEKLCGEERIEIIYKTLFKVQRDFKPLQSFERLDLGCMDSYDSDTHSESRRTCLKFFLKSTRCDDVRTNCESSQ